MQSSRAKSKHRAVRSSLTGPYLPNTCSKATRFFAEAKAVTKHLQKALGDRLADVEIGFITMPEPDTTGYSRLYYTVDKQAKRIMLHRNLIQRAKVLHVDDEEHRRLFIDHCVYRAVCDYLDEDPRYLIPDVFNHF